MLRRVIRTTPLSPDGVVEARELGRAPFVLLVEYMPPKKGKYRVKLRVLLRDEEVAGYIARHKLAAAELYVDRAAEAVAERKKELKVEFETKLSEGGLRYIWSHEPALALGKRLLNWVEEQRAVRVVFGTLLTGIEVEGQMQEVTWFARELTNRIDRMAAQIETGRAFEDGQMQVFAPGQKDKHKPEKPSTPPSRWRK